jgi:hypothetical protein
MTSAYRPHEVHKMDGSRDLGVPIVIRTVHHVVEKKTDLGVAEGKYSHERGSFDVA